MPVKNISISESLKLGWEKFKDNYTPWLIAILVLMLLGLLHGFLDTALSSPKARPEDFDYPSIPQLVLSFFFYVINIGIQLGLVGLGLKVVDGQKIDFNDLFSKMHLFLKYVIAHFIYGLIVFVGMILFIIPGIIWGLRYSLYPFFIVDKGAGPIEALKMSAEATNGAKWDLFGLAIVSGLIFFLGALLFFVGLFIAIPVLVIVWAYVYRKLSGTLRETVVQPEIVYPTDSVNS